MYEEVNQYYSDTQFNLVQQTSQPTSNKMKVFIVLAAVFAASASASLIASPVVGYNTHGLSGAPLVSGVRSVISPVSASYVSPIATRVVSPISAGLVSPIGYGAQYVSGVSHIQPVATRLVSPVTTRLVSSPVVTSVRTYSPVVNSVHLSPVATRVVAPISTYSVHSAPIVSNVVAPSLYASHGSGLYASGYLGKKL